MTEHAEPEEPATAGQKFLKPSGKSKGEVKRNRSFWVRWSAKTASLIIAGVIGAVAGASATDLISRPTSNPSSQGIAAPVVHISNVTWIPRHPGLYEVTGTALHLAVGEVLYTFNQLVTNNVGGDISPNLGPCFVKPDDTFDCSIGYAGLRKTQIINIIAAVVTDEQAYAFAQTVAGHGTTFSSIDALPRVGGSNALDYMPSMRTN